MRNARFVTGSWGGGNFTSIRGFPEKGIIPEHSHEARRKRYFNQDFVMFVIFKQRTDISSTLLSF